MIHLQFEKGRLMRFQETKWGRKSATISMLIGLKQPTQGDVLWTGTKIGVVFQTSVLDEMLTVEKI